MLPYNPGGHAAYQDTFVSDFLKFYPDPFLLPKATLNFIIQFWFLDLPTPIPSCRSVIQSLVYNPRTSCMLRSYFHASKVYDARTSVERSNKYEKEDYKLEEL